MLGLDLSGLVWSCLVSFNSVRYGIVWFAVAWCDLVWFVVIHLSLTCFAVIWFVLFGWLLFGLVYFGLLPFSVDKSVLVLYHYYVLFIIFHCTTPCALTINKIGNSPPFSLRSLKFLSWSKNSPQIIETEVSLPNSQKHVTSLYAEQTYIFWILQPILFKILFNIILPPKYSINHQIRSLFCISPLKYCMYFSSHPHKTYVSTYLITLT